MDLPGKWIDRAGQRRSLDKLILDLNPGAPGRIDPTMRRVIGGRAIPFAHIACATGFMSRLVHRGDRAGTSETASNVALPLVRQNEAPKSLAAAGNSLYLLMRDTLKDQRSVAPLPTAADQAGLLSLSQLGVLSWQQPVRRHGETGNQHSLGRVRPRRP